MVYCFYMIIKKTRNFSVGLSAQWPTADWPIRARALIWLWYKIISSWLKLRLHTDANKAFFLLYNPVLFNSNRVVLESIILHFKKYFTENYHSMLFTSLASFLWVVISFYNFEISRQWKLRKYDFVKNCIVKQLVKKMALLQVPNKLHSLQPQYMNWKYVGL